MSESIFKREALLFKALGNEARLRILDSLYSGDKSVTELCNSTGLDQARVSHELKRLVVCGLASYRRQGRYIIYSANNDTIPLIIRAAKDRVKRSEREIPHPL